MARRPEKDAPMDSEHHRSLQDVARLQALKLTGLMDSLPEASYDRFVRLASRLTGSPKAFLSLVDDRRQFLKATHGEENPARETPLSHSFCQYVASTGQPLAIEDARFHPTVKDNPAIQENEIIAYLGSPLLAQGKCIGSLCVTDKNPRRWGWADRQALNDLAACVNSEIELRTTNALSQGLAELLPAVVYLSDPTSGEILYRNETARDYDLTALSDRDTLELTHRDGSHHRFSHHTAPFGDGQLLGVATRLP